MNGGLSMKKVITVLTAMILALSLGACSSRDPAVMLKDDVSFRLMDALKVTNQTTNTVYYYYLASVDNQSQEAYSMDSLSFKVCCFPKTRDSSRLMRQIFDRFPTGMSGIPNKMPSHCMKTGTLHSVWMDLRLPTAMKTDRHGSGD